MYNHEQTIEINILRNNIYDQTTLIDCGQKTELNLTVNL